MTQNDHLKSNKLPPGLKPKADLLPAEIALAEKIGKVSAGKWSTVSSEDCVSHLYVILVKKYHSGVLTRYRATSGGKYALAELLRREAYTYCVKEETANHGGILGSDQSSYSYSAIKATIPYIFGNASPMQTGYQEQESNVTGMFLTQNTYNDVLNLIAEIKKVFTTLNKNSQEILTLRYEANLTPKEIATFLNLGESSVHRRISDAIVAIKDQL